jgi:hypothetical protein
MRHPALRVIRTLVDQGAAWGRGCDGGTTGGVPVPPTGKGGRGVGLQQFAYLSGVEQSRAVAAEGEEELGGGLQFFRGPHSRVEA